MIQEFVDIYMNNKAELQEEFEEKHPANYAEIVKNVFKLLWDKSNAYSPPNYKEIREIDDGDYQGTLLYIVPEDRYQPNKYWSVKVSYGSCSGCDTLESICDYSWDKTPDKEQVEAYMTLALHIIQGIKEI